MARWTNGSNYTYNNNIIYKDRIIGRRDLFENINYYNAYWALEFLKNYIDKKLLKSGDKKWVDINRSAYKMIIFFIYLYEEKDDKKLSEITEGDLEEYVYYLSHERTMREPRIYISYIKTLFDYMVMVGELSYNPAIKLSQTLNKQINKKAYTTNLLSDEQIEKAKKELPTHLKLYMFFSLSTGIKLHQIKKLKWEDVDLEKRIVVLKKEDQILYFNQEVADMLLNERNRRIEEGLNDFGYVFRSDVKQYFEKDSPISTNTISRWCSDIGVVIGVDNLKQLDFRHTATKKFLSASGSVGMTSIILNYPHLSQAAKYLIDPNVNNELLQEYKDICEI